MSLIIFHMELAMGELALAQFGIIISFLGKHLVKKYPFPRVLSCNVVTCLLIMLHACSLSFLLRIVMSTRHDGRSLKFKHHHPSQNKYCQEQEKILDLDEYQKSYKKHSRMTQFRRHSQNIGLFGHIVQCFSENNAVLLPLRTVF